MFKGSLVALITPMREDGSIDEKAYAEFVDWQIREGTDGVVPVGTTGESPTLSHDEHKRVVEITIEVAKGRVPVIAGAGSNSTEEAIDLTRHARPRSPRRRETASDRRPRPGGRPATARRAGRRDVSCPLVAAPVLAGHPPCA